MDLDFKLQSLQEMTDEIKNEFPNQPHEAIEEYLSHISEEKAKELREKLKDQDFLDAFTVAITHTSLMVTIALLKSNESQFKIDFDQYIRQYLFFARKDDKDIYEMRTFYLDKLNSQEMNLHEVDVSNLDLKDLTEEDKKSEIENARQNAKKIALTYDKIMQNLSKQYKDSKIHIA